MWTEVFGLIGNDAMVRAYRAGFGSTSPAAAMRTEYVSARKAFDTGLSRVFSPALLEELRACTRGVAAGGTMASRPNDRIALRHLADLLGGSLLASAEILRIDESTTANLETLRPAVEMDSLLFWFSMAIVADLDARWRTSDSVAEVLQLGPILTTLDQRIASLDPRLNALGIPREYVPVQSRSTPTDTRTNYERLADTARTAVADVTLAEATAAGAQRTFDLARDQIVTALAEAKTRYSEDISALCGNAFIVAGGTPDTDLSHCGTTADSPSAAGTYRGTIADGLAAQLQLQAALQRVADLNDRIGIQRETMNRVHAIQEADIAFVDSSNQQINLDAYVQTGLKAAELAIQVAANAQLWNLGAPAAASPVAALIETASGAVMLDQDQLRQAQNMHSRRASADETYTRDMAALQELFVQFAGLQIEVSIRANDVQRQLNAAATARERLLRMIADWQLADARAARPFVNDPAFRVIRDASTDRAIYALDRGRLNVYLAARALEYETNSDLSSLAQLAIGALNAGQLVSVMTCLTNAWGDWLRLVTAPQVYSTEVSLRRDVLNITGPRVDPDTGATISAGDQFRRYLMAQPLTHAGHVWPAIRFGTSLRPNNGLFSALVCNDRIDAIEAQLVGDFLGDNQAAVEVLVDARLIGRRHARP
ncbi:MAG: hypothetical protein WCJ30_15160, partial [Deltaproteobacteria bacterium]